MIKTKTSSFKSLHVNQKQIKTPNLLSNRYLVSTNLRKPMAKIHFRANTNNLFLTLTDTNDRVIFTRSTGMCTQEKNKRQQLSPLVIKIMVSDIARKMYKLKIARVEIVIRTRARRLFKNFMSYVRQNRMQVISIVDKRRLPHNGVRGKARTRK